MANHAEMLIRALDYIEEHMTGEISLNELAEHCFVSVSGMQKTFSYVLHMSVKEYILRRRFSRAAKDIVETRDSLLDIALKYGYSNAESFTRGFRKVWGITPSEFRKTRRFTGHTPRLAVPGKYTDTEGNIMENRIKFDLTELYDVIQARKNNAYVCADMSHLTWINERFGREAGDAALLELMRRVEDACDPDDVLLRIGGDEFVVFTMSSDIKHAEKIVRKVSEQNDRAISFDGHEIPIHIHIGAFQSDFTHHVSVNQMFSTITDGIGKIHETED